MPLTIIGSPNTTATVLNGFGAVYPGLFGAFVGLTTWTWGFLAVAVLPVLGHRVLRGLPS